MALTTRWAGDDDLDRVAETRLRCYAKAADELPGFVKWLKDDPRSRVGDYLLAEDDGHAVGTATHLSLTMHARGAAMAAQGVAWVGAVKTARRRTGGGVATVVMREMLRHARDRGDVVSALMPFRASYYEHFGYGVVERRNDWTVPLSVLPAGPVESVRFLEPDDRPARNALLRRVNTAGQCDFDWSDEYWATFDATADQGFEVIDRAGDGPARGAMHFVHEPVAGRDVVRVNGLFYEDVPALLRLLCFISSLKDQFAVARFNLPADLPFNWLLKEVQLPHRPVNHAAAEYRPFTRMQLRVLDHAKFLSALHWPDSARGSVVVAVKEVEGHESKLKIDVESGRAAVTATQASADFTCPDRVWAAVATGDMTASTALRLGLAAGESKCLDALSVGPTPYSHLYF